MSVLRTRPCRHRCRDHRRRCILARGHFDLHGHVDGDQWHRWYRPSWRSRTVHLRPGEGAAL